MRWKYARLTSSSQVRPGLSAARRSSRDLICPQASLVAAPLGLGADEAAGGEVFGTLAGRVGARRTRDRGTPSEVAATCSILVCSPWPISVPPWLIRTEPSLYTCTRAPAWLN